jgi:hypothetical protein
MLPSSLKAVAGISSSIITKIKQSLFAGSQFLDSILMSLVFLTEPFLCTNTEDRKRQPQSSCFLLFKK